jgi:SEC-C motif-containing protein
LYNKKEILTRSQNNQWCHLEILEVTPNTVTFKAHYIDNHKKEQIHYEKSTFIFEDGSWFYVDGKY